MCQEPQESKVAFELYSKTFLSSLSSLYVSEGNKSLARIESILSAYSHLFN